MKRLDEAWFKIKRYTQPLGEREQKIITEICPTPCTIRKDDGYYFVAWNSDYDQQSYFNRFNNFREMMQYLKIVDILNFIWDLDNKDHINIVSKLESLFSFIKEATIPLDFNDNITLRIIRRLSYNSKISSEEFPNFDRLLRNLRLELGY